MFSVLYQQAYQVPTVQVGTVLNTQPASPVSVRYGKLVISFQFAKHLTTEIRALVACYLCAESGAQTVKGNSGIQTFVLMSIIMLTSRRLSKLLS